MVVAALAKDIFLGFLKRIGRQHRNRMLVRIPVEHRLVTISTVLDEI
jgi:hypothetical protein